MQTYVQTIIEDQRLSPEEEQELAAISKNLNVTLQLDEETKGKLHQLKQYWALENLDLPVKDTEIHLQKNECCYFSLPGVSWHELRSVRHRSGYSGYSTSFKVAKGFYLRSGSYTPRSYTAQDMKLIDKGTLYVTNKRILFTGTLKNSNIRLEKIVYLNPYSDGVEIGKETGKSPLLILPDRADICCIILERLLRER